LAIFHSHIQIITRGKGKSAVAAAAYRAGEIIKNDYDGYIYDYTRKSGIVHTEILLPDHAPKEYSNRAILWNSVEKTEKATNSQLAREIDIALPIELTIEQNISLIQEYVKRTFVDKGMCADLCVHDNKTGNPHAHIMLTMRLINENGTWGGKQKKEYILDDNGNKIYDPIKRQYKCRSVPSTDWNNKANADIWRKAWEDMANAELERLGFDSRIDRRSYEEQGIEKIPTVHMGVEATQLERNGIRTERGDINRKIEITNKQIQQLRARITKLDKWITDAKANTKPPMLSDVITEILNRDNQSRLSRLKAASQMLLFLQDNKIADIEDLELKVNNMLKDVKSIRDELKKVNRRIDTLNEHLEHGENIKKYRKFKQHHMELQSQYRIAQKNTGFGAERKAKKALEAIDDYYEIYRAELTLYDAADKYMKNVMQGRYNPNKLPPITKWQEELATKTATRYSLYQEYYALKNETIKVEKIKWSVTEIMESEKPERAQQKSQNIQH